MTGQCVVKQTHGGMENIVLYATKHFHVCWSLESRLIIDSRGCMGTDSFVLMKYVLQALNAYLNIPSNFLNFLK